MARLNELNVQLDLDNGRVEDMDLCEGQDNARVAEQGDYRADCRREGR